MRVLITGASGFVGSHLTEYLASKGVEVHGTVFGHPPDYLTQHLSPKHISALNLLERDAVFTLMQNVQPNAVIHLAALTSPAKSFDSAAETYANNIRAQLNLLDACLDLPQLPRVMVIGSAEEYGKVAEEDNPIHEEVQLRPTSPYAVSKIAQDFMGLQYFLAYGLPVIRIRPFNHTGERRPPTFVLPAFAKQIAEIEAGLAEPVLRVGNLEPYRDFTDVKDMVRAYDLALEKAVPGDVYNIGSGKPVQIRELLEMLLKHSGVEIKVEIDEKKFRPVETPRLIADYSKFHTITGWEPQIPLEETVGRVLDYWRQQVKTNTN